MLLLRTIIGCVHPRFLTAGLTLIGCLWSGSAAWSADATINIQANQPGAVVSSNLFGIFFEEINYGGDGGLYAELIRNRTFGNSTNPDFWSLVTNSVAAGTMAVDASQPINANNLRALFLTKSSGSGGLGAANSGYWGIALQAGATYDLNLYARGSNGFSGPLNVRLESGDGSQVYAAAAFNGLTTGWQKFSAALVPGGTSTNARLVLSLSNNASVWLDDVSLFPRATFSGRTNGMRADLAGKLADLRPSFFRFPGGCYVEGNVLANAFRWKRSIGDTAQRPGHWNGVWNYFSTDGLGFHEYLQLCEDLGAEPLFGINCGMSHGEVVPLADMGPWVQDALDAIEYANGGTNTTWGALRAANGHPAPFNLKYMEIGNENGGADYNSRYALFYDAIKAAHPGMKLIACVWGGTPTSRPFDLMDEHYYTSPATMASYATKYDGYNRSGPKVFVGEFAVTSGYGTYGNLAAALGEAAFMTGIERNSDIVELACYAPLFANVNGMQWHPNLINYDNSRSFGTPAYYAQQLFSRNRGDVVLPITVSAPLIITNPPPRGAIGLGSWSTAVQYTNVVVTSNGVTLYQSDFVTNGTNGWRVYNGTWSVANGCYQQTAAGTTDCRSTTGNTNWSNYTLSLRARKVSGSEGFLILFNWTDDNNWTWLNLGGWGNTLHGVEQNLNGSKTTLGTRVSGSIVTNQWYDISVVLTGPRVQCYLDGVLALDVTNLLTSSASLYASSLYDQASQQIVIKAVNPSAAAMSTAFNVAGVGGIATNATLVQLASGSSADENTLAAPTYVSPATNQFSLAGTNFSLSLPANSLSVLRLQLAAPLPPVGFKATPVGWQIALSWPPYRTATNYVVRRATTPGGPYSVLATTSGTSFADTTVAIGSTYYYVLSAALPSGLTPESSEVSASVGATLRAHLPFDETAGTTAADKTGNGWDGTLFNNPSWVTGWFSNAVSLTPNQYVSLPTGVVGGLTNCTISLWANLNSAGMWSRLFDFGNGTSTYMFLTPSSGSGNLRFAMTTNGNGGEQRLDAPSALPTNGWHHLAITLGAGGGILYLDGSPVATNGAMSLAPAYLGVLTQNWIGRSQFSGDPYLNGRVDDLRIFQGALSAGEVASLTTPLLPPAGLAAVGQHSCVMLNWNASSNANGYNLKRAGNTGGPYTVIASNLVGLAFADVNVLNGQRYYYVVAATNTVDVSADSSEVVARPVATNAPPISAVVAGAQYQLTWPADHLGWRLEAQTNSAGAGLGTNWVTLSGSALTNQLSLPLQTTNGSCFFRLVYP